mgnify:CR=1 FL=1
MTMENERRYRVVLVGGLISDMISGHDNLADAEARAAMANEQAEKLGIDARYEARERASEA